MPGPFLVGDAEYRQALQELTAAHEKVRDVTTAGYTVKVFLEPARNKLVVAVFEGSVMRMGLKIC